ncbi:MAG: Ni/Fe-hydrogenase, b-type cytochrome subunit [Desulfuromonadales bacterium]
MLEIRYVWEWPVRLTHWINVLSIVVLSFTGFYIGYPFITAPATAGWVMGWNRFLHFVFAYLLTISLATRILWFFLGNRHASWRAFVPWATTEGRKNMVGTFRYYTFLKKKVPYVIGHNALAAVAYSGIFVLIALQVVSGFALYGQFQPGGFWDGLFGPLLVAFGNQGLRLTHHVIMWLLIGFAIHHIYSAWLMDIKEKNGTLTSIFSGYKFVEPEDIG